LTAGSGGCDTSKQGESLYYFDSPPLLKALSQADLGILAHLQKGQT
jgi:hypothetical protein